MFAKAGRAEAATDPAPLEMFESTIQFKARDQWRPGMTPEKLVEELDRTVKVPGLSNIWVPPIRYRIDMLATGIKSPSSSKSGARDPKAQSRGAGDTAHHLCAALSHIPPLRRRAADHGDIAFLARRRVLAHVPARLRHVDRFRAGIYRIGWSRVEDWRGDAPVHQSGSRGEGGGREA